MTPLARAVEAGRTAYGEAVSKAIWGEKPDGDVLYATLLAALEVLGPVIVERAKRIQWYDDNSKYRDTYPDWPAIRASLTEREP